MKKSRSSRPDKYALKALRVAVGKAIRERKKSGVSMSIWKNGKVVTIPAHKIDLRWLDK